MENNTPETDFYRKYYRDLETGVKIPETLSLNTIHHGDCIDLIKLIPDNSVRLIVSDPPYFLGMTHNGQRGAFVDLAICKPFYKELFKQYARVLNSDGEAYWFTDWRGYAFYYPLFDAFLGARNVICWDKGSGAGNFYAFQHEFILYHSQRVDVAKKGGNVWRSPGFAAGAKKTNGEKVHPTQKTIEIIEKIVSENSRPGDVVLDTFGGSGTTGLVCEKLKRNYIIFELDEDNIDIAHKRQKTPLQPGLFEVEDLNQPLNETTQPALFTDPKK
jgi:site-specific DNA-methyltransferase (adenine-specific)